MWSDSIQDDLPTQRPDEPPHLRDDIADELNDHLASAMRRELLKDHDEPAATRRVLARFGNPARIARQLYLAAMKEQLMKDRITIGLMTAIALFCAVTLLLVWNMTRRTDAMQQQFVMAIGNMQSSLAELDRYAMEWGSLTIELTDTNGKPVVGCSFHIIGQMYGVSKVTRNLATDEQGRIVLDAIRTGTEYDVLMDESDGDVKGWQYRNVDFLLLPGEDKVLRLVLPDKPTPTPVTFNADWPDIAWPESWSDSNLRLACRIVPERITLSDPYEGWSHDETLVWFENGEATRPEESWHHRIAVSQDGRFLLPSGQLSIETIQAYRVKPNDQAVQLFELDLRDAPPGFEVTPGDVNHIRIPLPDKVREHLHEWPR